MIDIARNVQVKIIIVSFIAFILKSNNNWIAGCNFLKSYTYWLVLSNKFYGNYSGSTGHSITKESIIEKTYCSENLPSPLFPKRGRFSLCK